MGSKLRLCCRMCLFLQSQDFQRHTEFMINSLYGSAQHADENLRSINRNLQTSLDTMSDLDSSLSSVAAAQHKQQQLAEAGLRGVQHLHDDAQTVQNHLSHVLQNEASTARQISCSAHALLAVFAPGPCTACSLIFSTAEMIWASCLRSTGQLYSIVDGQMATAPCIYCGL